MNTENHVDLINIGSLSASNEFSEEAVEIPDRLHHFIVKHRAYLARQWEELKQGNPEKREYFNSLLTEMGVSGLPDTCDEAAASIGKLFEASDYDHFFDLTPSYIHGQLSLEDAHWFDEYLQEHSEAQNEVDEERAIHDLIATHVGYEKVFDDLPDGIKKSLLDLHTLAPDHGFDHLIQHMEQDEGLRNHGRSTPSV